MDGVRADFLGWKIPHFGGVVREIASCIYFDRRLGHRKNVVSSSPTTSDVTGACIQKAVAGDRSAQHEVLKAHTDFIRGMLYRLLGSADDLDDLFQNVCVEFMQSIHRFRSEATISTWLGGICVNVVKTNFRRRKKDRALMAIESDNAASEPVATGDASATVEARIRVEQVFQLLESMSEGQRMAFVLKTVYDYSIDEIAAITKSAKSTTRMRLYYARKKFAKAVKREGVTQKNADLVPKLEEI